MGMKILTGCCTHIIVVLEGLWLVPLIVVQLTQPGQHAGVWWHHAYQLQEPDTTHCKHTCQPQEPDTTHRKHTPVSCRNLTHCKHTPVSCRNMTQHITNTHLSAAGTSHITNTPVGYRTSHITNNIYQLQEPDTTHHQQSVKSCSGETSAGRRYAKCWFNFNCINNCTFKKKEKKRKSASNKQTLGNVFTYTHAHKHAQAHHTHDVHLTPLKSWDL